MSLVLDVSNWDLDTFDAPCLRDSGVERIIIGCWHYEATETILKRARAAGILVEDLYAYLYYGTGVEQREVTNALSIAREYGGIRRIWADCEASPPHEAVGMTPTGRIQATWRAVEAIASASIEVGIYTYKPYWVSQMAGTSEFSRLPLWFANYGTNDPERPREPIRDVDFGGWRGVAVHQYSSAIVRCGRARDHNYWYLEDEMPDPRVDAIVAALGGMEAIEAWNRNGNSLLLGYAIEQEKQAKLAAEQVRLAEMVAAGDTLAAGDVVDAMKAMIAAWERERAR